MSGRSVVRECAEDCAPGDLTLITIHASVPRREWLVRCPRCKGFARLHPQHTVEVVDGVPTVSPSLVCPSAGCGAHYWIRSGQIEGV